MSETILVTGGAGYIGSHAAYLLAQEGYDVLVLDLFTHGQYFKPKWARVIQGDCGDKKLLADIFAKENISAVMHFAADIEVGRSMHEPLAFYENNVAKTITLLDAMRAHGVNTFIFSSSCAVYGIPEHTPIAEDHPIKPVSPYGTTKSIIEKILMDCAQAYGLRFIALRYFNAAGALPEEHLGEQHVPETHIIPLLLAAARKKMPFCVFGSNFQTRDGSAIRDYVHVLDIARAHVLALHHLKQDNPPDIFNLGTGAGFSVKEMIAAVESILRTSIKVNWVAPRAGDPPILVADPTKANNILRWRPRLSDLTFIIQSAAAFQVPTIRLQEPLVTEPSVYVKN